jgi:hypothetical protein
MSALINIGLGLGISWLFGGAGLFIGILLFSIAFPTLFKVLWYLIMFPAYVAAFAFAGWIFLPMLGIGGWNSDFFCTLCIPSVLPAIWACSPAGVGPGSTYVD